MEYETEFGSYYESNSDAANETEVWQEDVSKVAGEITPPRPETPREKRFLEEFERKLSEQPSTPTPPATRPRPKADAPGQLEIASWLPGPVKQEIIKRAAMEAYDFHFDKEYVRSDGQRFKVRTGLRRRLLDALKDACEKGDKTILVNAGRRLTSRRRHCGGGWTSTIRWPWYAAPEQGQVTAHPRCR
jgi:hypothetical protein